VLVVTSNWCIPDGSLVAGPVPGLVGRFRAEVRRACLRAGCGADGRYRPVQGVAVVCAGDTFDWLTSREWIGDVRPGESGRRAAAARERAAASSLRKGVRLLSTLATWVRRGLVVPSADRRGRPLPGSVHRVGVRVSLLRGDRDRWIDGLPVPEGMAGLAVGIRWSDGDVTVRHGEEIEPPWSTCVAEPTLGESLAVELIARFAASLAGAARSWPRGAAVVRGIVLGRVADAPARLAAALDEGARSGTLAAGEREAVAGEWNRAVSAWHRAARRLGVGRAEGVDVVDELASAMTLSGDAPPPPATARWSAQPECREDDAVVAGCCEILGHPPAGYVPSLRRHGRLFCIGPQPLQDVALDRGAGGGPRAAGLALFDPPGMISGVGDGIAAAVPSAVAVHPGALQSRLEWLSLASGGTPSDAHGGRAWHRGIWRSQKVSSDWRVVDAA
jgi:hypothetical protein